MYPPRHLRFGAVVVLVALLAAVVLLASAMQLYPGGSVIDRQASRHSFWFNFLCDLTGDRSLLGVPNPGFRYARAALVSLGVALGCFWLILPALFPEAPRAGTFIRIAGPLSAMGLMGIPLANGPMHAVAIYATLGPGLSSTVVALSALARRRRRDVLLLAAASGAVVAGAIDSVLYARRVLDHFESCPLALPALQRLAVLFMIVWMGTTAWRVLRAR